ncbi:unnamed protein product [Phytophthora fragariaefolia]|uniref:Unnamed protein product n=1 Tax=Phytophthora fragariaefolia TaxID=1490495 RepID=A0A9W7DBC8_9STRA|nr:unnamed protein product [Phytophthora fragariaefolia]
MTLRGTPPSPRSKVSTAVARSNSALIDICKLIYIGNKTDRDKTNVVQLAEEQKLWETFMLLLAVIGILCVSVEGELLGVELAQLVEEGKLFSTSDPLAYSAAFIVLKGVLSGTSGLLLASNPTETNASDSFWLTIVTITGVGYGDTFPWTLGGKLVIAIGGIIGGMVITCLFRVVLIDSLQLSPQEQTVLGVARFYRYVHKRKASAAVLIQQAWKWHRVKKLANGSKHHTRAQKARLYAAAEAFRLLRFAQPPSLAGDSNSNSLWSPTFLSEASMADVVVKQTERLRERIDERHRRSRSQMEQTANLFRSIAEGA